MKNIQIIDGAENCTYSIYSVSEDDFKLIFPGKGQDIEFESDLNERLPIKQNASLYKRLFEKPIRKKLVQGIHGTLFYELNHKKAFYPTRRESEMIVVFLNKNA